MTRSEKYWANRFEQLQEKLLHIGEEHIDALEKEYRRTQKRIEREVETFYERLAENNAVSLADARKLLRGNDLEEFHWSVEEYIQKGRENAISQQWMKQLENASNRVHISWLEKLNLQIESEIELLSAKRDKGLTSALKNVLEDGYYETIFEVQRGIGVGTPFYALDTQRIEMTIRRPWTPDGSNFSSRIWRDRNLLVHELQTELTQAFIRGDAPDKAIKAIADTMGASRKAAGRLVMTETAFFAEESRKQAFEELDVEQYENVATLDPKTSEICQDMDGSVFKMSEYKTGVTAPPFHPWCRTCTVPHFDDNYTERAARGTNGETYYVDGDMDYEQWKNSLSKADQDKMVLDAKKARNYTKDKEQYDRYKEVLGKDSPRSFAAFQEMKYNKAEEWNVLKADYRKVNAYNRIITNEPPITADLKAISEATGVEMVGLEYRLKSKESYLRKVNMESGNATNISMIDDTISKTNDVIRYTYQADHTDLVEKYSTINKALLEKGYKQTKVKNTWLIKGNPYKGINCNYRTPSGQGFEVQYHTPESFELKNGPLHKLYEEWRVVEDKTSDQAQELAKEMAQLSSKLKSPDGIDKVR